MAHHLVALGTRIAVYPAVRGEGIALVILDAHRLCVIVALDIVAAYLAQEAHKLGVFDTLCDNGDIQPLAHTHY